MKTLRDYQVAAVDSIFNYFGEKSGNPLVVIPCGGGKSLILADFLKKVMCYWPDQRILILSHVKEILEQDINELFEYWPTAPAGLYSAGLGEKNPFMSIVYGGVASVAKNIASFGYRHLLVVDEAHSISQKDNSMYQLIIKELKAINPDLKVIGLTATPFRLGQGMLTDDGLFTDICYDLTTLEPFNRLIAQGYLAPLITKKTAIKLNVSGIKIQNGDYNQHDLQEAVDIDALTLAACQEAIAYGHNRKSWLFFASGIDHAQHVAACLQNLGVSATYVHSKMSDVDRDEHLTGFKSGKYQAIVNNGILTTGFNHRATDMIIFLRPTTSTGLWCQMLGRGIRICEGKTNCLILDFAGNTERLGPINDPQIPKKKGQKIGDIPIKLCPQCQTYHHLSVRVCDQCGHEFPRQTKLHATAGIADVLATGAPVVEEWSIDRIEYRKHTKLGSQPSLRVTYHSGLRKIDEYVCLFHAGYAGRKAFEWWKRRTEQKLPLDVETILEHTSDLRMPSSIRVWVNKKYPEIISEKF